MQINREVAASINHRSNREYADLLIRGDKRVTVQNFADALNVSYDSAEGITADLGYHKVSDDLVPKQLQTWAGQ